MTGNEYSKRSLHRKLTCPHAALSVPRAFSSSNRPSRQLSVQFTDDADEKVAKTELPWLFLGNVSRPEEKIESPKSRRGDELGRSTGLGHRAKIGQEIGLEMLHQFGIQIEESTLANLGIKNELDKKWNKEGYIQEVITGIINCDKDDSPKKGPDRPKSFVRNSD